jgi:hypothetical protein
MKNLKFLLDGDDVVLKTGDQKVIWLNDNLKAEDIQDKNKRLADILPEDCSRSVLVPIIGEDNYNRMVENIYSAEGTSRIRPVDGALAGVEELAKMGEVYVVSARRPDQVENTRTWLNANGFNPYIGDRVYAEKDPRFKDVEKEGGSKKVGIALNLGARMFVDDDERHMPNEPVSVDCLLFGDQDRNVKPHILAVKNWRQVVEYAKIYK